MKALGDIEQYRCTARAAYGAWATTAEDGPNGMFRIPKWEKIFRCIVSDGEGWEHVSVSKEGKATCPTWEEMCWVKSLFWSPEEVVIQIHPAESQNISLNDYCLHLWRPTNAEIPLPDPIMVGPLALAGRKTA